VDDPVRRRLRRGHRAGLGLGNVLSARAATNPYSVVEAAAVDGWVARRTPARPLARTIPVQRPVEHLRQLRDGIDRAAALTGGALLTGELASVVYGGPYVLNAPAIELVPARPRQASAALEQDGWIAALLAETELDDQRVPLQSPSKRP